VTTRRKGLKLARKGEKKGKLTLLLLHRDVDVSRSLLVRIENKNGLLIVYDVTITTLSSALGSGRLGALIRNEV